jgi:predicted transcriptional regulator
LKSLPQGEDGSLSEALNMAALAKRLNISRASLYRVLDKLVEDGKIEKSGNTLIIKEDYSRKEE